ncbi:MAG: hypothetical protein BWY54_00525 [Candidatus Dependentiae bacterium ADurb.Bin331]|nr:MAG: hypothetical protein BWY54_00525 [Candidatus Dependentiae bacterium ADurb.Bin331]
MPLSEVACVRSDIAIVPSASIFKNFLNNLLFGSCPIAKNTPLTGIVDNVSLLLSNTSAPVTCEPSPITERTCELNFTSIEGYSCKRSCIDAAALILAPRTKMVTFFAYEAN